MTDAPDALPFPPDPPDPLAPTAARPGSPAKVAALAARVAAGVPLFHPGDVTCFPAGDETGTRPRAGHRVGFARRPLPDQLRRAG